MSKLNAVLDRLDTAVGRLEVAIDAGMPEEIEGEATPEVPVLRAERYRLEGEIQELRARAEEDARLRQEAAQAVREALRDLRGAVGQGAPANA